MPVVAWIDSIKVMLFANEHPPPHFHVQYAEHQAVIGIASLDVIEGSLPVAQRRKVVAWAGTRKAKLTAAFVETASHGKVEMIE